MKEINKLVSIDKVDLVKINIKEGTVTIVENQTNNIEINGTGGTLYKGVDIKKEGNILTINQKVRFFPIKLKETTLKISIPKKYQDTISIHQGTGSLFIKDVKIKKLNIATLAARLNVDDILFESLIANLGTRLSDINLKQKCGDIQISSNVGKVFLRLNEIGGNLDFNGGTNGGVITIPDNAPIKINNQACKKIKINVGSLSTALYNFHVKPHVGTIKINN